jgi:hypothetical protein
MERHKMAAQFISTLSEKRSAVLNRWIDHILNTYPADTANFLRDKKSRFANPVGHSISEGVEGIFDDLISGIDRERVAPFLDKIIRIRAIQDFAPSQAVSFIFFLKTIIREELAKEIHESGLSDELEKMEDQIDSLGLIAFDIFMGCREKLYDIKANEMKNMTFRLLQKANMISDKPGKEPDDTDSNSDNLNEKR